MSAERPLNKASIHDYPLPPGFPLPSDRGLLQHQIIELEKAYHQRYLTDPVFHARSRTIGNFLHQLESVDEAGDTERVGFLIAALLDRDMGERELQRNAWEAGMAAAKLAALGIKPAKNPYLRGAAMSNDNYPAGVTDAHPHFNPSETSATVECGADEALVVPSFAVKETLNDLQEYVTRLAKLHPEVGESFSGVSYRINMERERLEALEQEGDYVCPFNDTLDLEESECAQWVCPTCGNDRETDTLPEEQDPDRAYEEMRDARYDD